MKKFIPTLFIVGLLFITGCREAEEACDRTWEHGSKEWNQCVETLVKEQMRTFENP